MTTTPSVRRPPDVQLDHVGARRARRPGTRPRCSRAPRSSRRGARARAATTPRPVWTIAAARRRGRAERARTRSARARAGGSVGADERAHLVRAERRARAPCSGRAAPRAPRSAGAPSPFSETRDVLGPHAGLPRRRCRTRDTSSHGTTTLPGELERRRARRSRRSCSSRRRSSRRRSSPARGTGCAASAYCSTLPPDMTAIRSEIESASSWSCVTNTVVMPMRCWISRMSSRTRTRSFASRFESGSSSSSTFGSSTSARASATRCCSPPEMRAG